ncbi:MAG: hypothetical protein K6G60_03145 [Lachnospiraceae bacterium]|nr:hypothetical protein [Lachnospiraceae bacterium]
MDTATIKKDRLRYSKNTLSSNFALLAILFNIFYFVSVYKTDAGNYFYSFTIGVSVIYNLLFMLFTFLSSEGIKKYSLHYSVLLIVIGVLQIARVFYLPAKAHAAVITTAAGNLPVIGDALYTRLIIFLLISAAFAISGGVIGVIKNRILNEYTKNLSIK